VPERLWLPQEVADYFRIRRIRTVYEWIANGEFPNTRIINRQYRIPDSDIKAYDERCRAQRGELPVVVPGKRRVISKGVL
jgi:excisionase family DNA binding protein